jgi:hypothetical protein
MLILTILLSFWPFQFMFNISYRKFSVTIWSDEAMWTPPVWPTSTPCAIWHTGIPCLLCKNWVDSPQSGQQLMSLATGTLINFLFIQGIIGGSVIRSWLHFILSSIFIPESGMHISRVLHFKN